MASRTGFLAQFGIGLVGSLIMGPLNTAGLAAMPSPLLDHHGESAFQLNPPVLIGQNERVLEGMLWRLTGYPTGTRALMEPAPNTEATIQFRDGRMGGNASCNRYFGSYDLSGESLSIQPGGSTSMACLPEVMQQEQAFLSALAEVAAYEIVDGELQLRNEAGDAVLTFAEFTSPDLSGTLWQVSAYHDGGSALVSPLAGTSITAVFDDNGGIAGSAGCNSYISSYELSGNTLTVGPGVSTRKFCAQPEGVMEQEAAYLAALERAVSYSLEGNVLEFQDSDGTPVVRFAAAN